MVYVKFGIIALFIIVGIFFVKPDNWRPFMPFGFSGVLDGAALVFLLSWDLMLLQWRLRKSKIHKRRTKRDHWFDTDRYGPLYYRDIDFDRNRSLY